MKVKSFSSGLMILLCAGILFAQARIDLTTGTNAWQMAASSAAAIVPGIADAGATISTAAYAPTTAWCAATVPGTVFSTYVDAGKFSNPYVDRNIATQLFEQNKDIAMHAASNNYGFWYRTTFTIDPSFNGRQIWLRFKGINYKAQIWVNGTHINDQEGNATSVGAFKPFRFNITSVASFTGQNALAVFIYPNSSANLRAWHQPTARDHKNNGGSLSGDGPTFICSEGWDWIPTVPDRDIGIYDQVILEPKGSISIREPYINPTLSSDYSSASVAISAQLENATAASVSGTFTATLNNGQTVSAAVTLAANQKQIVKLNPVTIANPALWWPNGYGPQNRYTCQFSFTEGTTLSDSVSVKFGCRKITSNLVGSFLNIYCNDKYVMCKGGNWGMDEAMKRWDPAHLTAQMKLSKNSNVTMIRNWVGQTDRELFYDLASEYGIMMYDEFWCPNPVDGPLPNDVNLFLNHAMERIKRYRNEPCEAIYCAANEGDRGSAIDNGLQNMIDTLHHGMPFVTYSTNATQGLHGNGPYGWRNPNSIFGEPQQKGFTTEVGQTSVWLDRTARKTLSQANLWPVFDGSNNVSSNFWGWHDFCGASAMQGDAFCAFMAANYAPVYPGDNLGNSKEFCKYAQCMNYDGYRAMFEAWNSLIGAVSPNVRTGGILIWMSNSSWPSNVWQSYDSYLDCNGAYYGLQNACEPIHIQATFNTTDNNHYLDVINNTLTAVNGTASCEIWNMSTTGIVKAATQTSTVSSFAPLAKTYSNVQINNSISSTSGYFMNCIFKDGTGKVISKNVYARGKGNDWSQLKTLKDLAKLTVGQDLTVTGINATKSGTTNTITAVVSNTSTNKVGHMIHLTLLKHGVVETGSGASYVDPRVLPTYFSTNYITLFPGETQNISLQFDSKDAGNAGVDLEVTGVTVNDNGPLIGLTGIESMTMSNLGQIKNMSFSYVPSQGIVVKMPGKTNFSISVFDMLGKMVAAKEVQGASKVTVGAKSMVAGMYFVKVRNAATAQSIVQKVMVR